ncbi:hypothetical protein BH23GEM2_BH23GEM2_03130 [soil metagenome]
MQVCVTFGNWCTLGRLERVEAADPPQLLRALDELTHAGVVTSDGTRVLARHDLLSQAARKRLPDPLRMLIHRRIAGVLEAEGKDAPVPALLWECAHHWEMAGEIGRAVDFLDECGRHLISVGLPEEATELYRRAVGLHIPDLTQRIALHDGLVSALRLNGLWEQVLCEVATIREIAHGAGHPLDLHSPLELTEVEARWRTDGMNEAVRAQLDACVNALNAPASHRLNAAFWVLAVAQSTGQADLAHEVWHTVKSLTENPKIDAIARYQVAMVYHTDYGDLEQAALHARSLVDHAHQVGEAIGVVRALRNGSLAMRRAGRWDECEAFLTEAFELAGQHHAALGAVDSANQLAALSLDRGDLKTAAMWTGVADGWVARCESKLQAIDLQITQTRVAILSGDRARAHDLSQLLPPWRNDQDLRRGQVVASIHLVLATTTGEVVDEDILAAAERMYRLLRDRGHQDFPVEALVCAYRALGREQKARELLHLYLSGARRDRGPLPPQIRASGQALGLCP